MVRQHSSSSSPNFSSCWSSCNYSWRLFQKTIEGFKCKINGWALWAAVLCSRLASSYSLGSALSLLQLLQVATVSSWKKVLPLLRHWLTELVLKSKIFNALSILGSDSWFCFMGNGFVSLLWVQLSAWWVLREKCAKRKYFISNPCLILYCIHKRCAVNSYVFCLTLIFNLESENENLAKTVFEFASSLPWYSFLQ